jgi:hypothetical protein
MIYELILELELWMGRIWFNLQIVCPDCNYLFVQARNHTSAKYVTRTSHRMVTSKSIYVYILERNLSVVIIVAGSLQHLHK